MTEKKAYKIAVFFPPWYSHLISMMEALLDIRGIRHHCQFRNFISSDMNQAIELPQGYQPDGILTSYDEDNFDAEWLDDFGIPVVNIFPAEKKKHPSVFTSVESVAEIVVSHFQALNFKEIGVVKTINSKTSDNVTNAIEKLATEKGLGFWCEAVSDGIAVGNWMELRSDAPNLEARLTQNTKRCGIYTMHDVRGRSLVEFATELGVKIPEEVGVLGRFDSLNARLCTPELSSIMMPVKELATSAIQLLIDLIEGNEVEEKHIFIPVQKIKARESTLGQNSQDILILKARQLIREEACKGLTVDQLIQDFPMARSTFEKRYRILCGMSAAQDIRRVRQNHARELLLTTKESIEDIAKKVGFTDPRPFVVFFKREAGMTPGEFRKQNSEQ